MAETMDRATLLDTIKKLLNVQVTKGATTAEAASAAAAAQRMCAKHGIAMMEVEKHRLKEAGLGVVDEEQESFYKNLPDWAGLLVVQIANAFDCKLVLGKKPIGKFDAYKRTGFKCVIHFIGVEVDAVIARYLYVRLENELYAMATESARREGYRGAQVNTYRKNFIQAAALEIGRRLREQREELKKTEQKMGALIIFKGELVKQFVHEKYGNTLTKGKRLRHSTGMGTNAGREAGQNVDLQLNRLDGQSRSSGNIA